MASCLPLSTSQTILKFSAMSTPGNIEQVQGFLRFKFSRLVNLEMVFTQSCAQSALSEKMPGKMTKRDSQMVCTVPLRKIKTLKATITTEVCRQNLKSAHKVRVGIQFISWQSCNFSFSLSCPLLPCIKTFVCMIWSN